jgi:hypothetical protein
MPIRLAVSGSGGIPPYIYICLFYFYRPLRTLLPRRLAMIATFLASGFLLHDLPFGNGMEIVRRHPEIPQITLLFAIFAALVLLTDGLGLEFARRARFIRAIANLTCLSLAFAARWALLLVLSPS